MFKFLRKYNKWILAVGGTLLMIVFLIPQAFTSLSRGAGTQKATLATVGAAGDPVKFAEFSRVQQEVQAMRDVGLQVVRLGPIQDPWHWYLLTREARQQGLMGGRLSPQDLQALASLNFRRPGLQEAVTNLDGVNRMISLYQTTGQFSDRRLKTAADELFHMVRLRPVVIEASADAIDYKPSEAELQTQLELWADSAPDDPEARFGYLLPDRVKLEWLTISRNAVRAMIQTTDALSGTALRKHWRLNADNPDLPPMPTEPPATVPDAVRDDLLDQLTDEKMKEIVRFGTNQFRAKMRVLSRDEGYVVIPEDWATTRVSMTALAQEMANRFAMALPSYQSSGDRWLSAADVAGLPGVGTSGTNDFPPQRRTLSDLVTNAREFGGSMAVLIQGEVTGPPLDDADGNVHFFRIIDTDSSRSPESVEEVREQLVADLRRLRHYESLVSDISRLSSQAQRRGLLSVAIENDTTVQREQLVAVYDRNQFRLQLLTGQPLEPTPTNLPIIGPHEATVREIIARARKLPAGVAVDDLTDEQRINAVPVDDKLALLIYRLTEQIPLNQGTYEQLVNTGQLQTVLINEELDPTEAITTAFGLDALSARHQLEIIRQDDETTDLEADPAEEDTATLAIGQ